jgi:hypothetical protein
MPALAARGVLERQPQVFKIGDERVQVFVCFHSLVSDLKGFENP